MPVQSSYSNDLAVAYAGQLVNAPAGGIMTLVNAEASAVIPFARAVAFKPSSTDDKQATLPANAGDRVCGIVLRSHAYGIYPFGDLDQTNGGIVVGGQMNVLAIGEVWAIAEDGCVPGDRLWVRRTVGGDGAEVLGSTGNADEGTETIDCTAQGVWLTTASAGGLARLRVDFNAKQVDAA